MDVALLVLRIVVGGLLAAHGSQKLFGWFGGHGLAGTGGFFESIGFKPGKPMAFLAGLGEAGGGLLLVLGFLNPLATVAVVAVMLNAMVPHWGKGPFAANGGWELALTYGVIGAVVGFTGPGSISLDNAFGWTLFSTGWGIGAVVLGLVLGLLNIAGRAIQMGNAGSTQTA